MKVHNSELIEALVDNELKGWRRWSIQRHVSRCPACALTYRRHLRVRRMLQSNPVTREMDDSAEFFWSKVKNDVESQSWVRRAFRSRAPDPGLRDMFWRPALIPSLAVAAIVMGAGVFWLMQDVVPMRHAPEPAQIAAPITPPTPAPTRVAVATIPPRFAEVESVDTSLPDTVATSFKSKEDGVTVIWVSGLPWTKDMTELQTLLANLDT